VFTDYKKWNDGLAGKIWSGIGILPLVNFVTPALVFRFMLSSVPLLRVPTLPPLPLRVAKAGRNLKM
jgi:hypothetical protein